MAYMAGANILIALHVEIHNLEELAALLSDISDERLQRVVIEV